MIGLIDEFEPDGTRRFGVGHFDLVVIDEAHRSVYKKYRGIFEYFDSYLVGLTATPRDQVDKNTYDLFDLETGVPTDAYSLEEAIEDRHLVPPEAYSVPLKFIREGIRYDDLSDDEKEQWDDLDWDDEDGDPPDEVNAHAINQWLFNADTVDKVLENLMTDGIKVAGGDRVGKTIVFAKNQRHAEFIGERFNLHYPALAASGFARVITNQTNYAQSLIDDFGQADKVPHIAISVDMLDTGIDVPECVNLVFFKVVRSRTKFWQMIGRGTRLSPDLFGPGDHKTKFRVFDYCMNLEYFGSDMAGAEGALAPSLTERLWNTRIDILHAFGGNDTYIDERATLEELLRVEVDSMNRDNFLVRPHLENVNRYREPEPWKTLSPLEIAELRALGDLPRELDPEHEDAKRFDILVLGAQLGVLNGSEYNRQRTRIQAIAGLLQEKDNTLQVAAEMELIVDVQSDEWWEDVTYQMLEAARTRLGPWSPCSTRNNAPSSTATSKMNSAKQPSSTSCKAQTPSNSSARKPNTSCNRTSANQPSPKSAPVNRSPPPTSPTCNDSSLPQGSATTPPSKPHRNEPAASDSSSDRSSDSTEPQQKQRSNRSWQTGTTPAPKSTSSTSSSTNSPAPARSKSDASTTTRTSVSPLKDPKRSSPKPRSTN